MSRVAKSRVRSFSSRETIPVLSALPSDPSPPNADPRVPVFLRDPRDEDRLRLKRDKQRSYDRRRRESAVHQGDTRLAYDNFYAGGLLNIIDPILFTQRSFTMAVRSPDALLTKSLHSLSAPDFTVELDLDAEYHAKMAMNSSPMYFQDLEPTPSNKLAEHDLVLQSSQRASESRHAAVAAAHFPSEELAKAVANQQISAQMIAIQHNHAASAKTAPDDMLEHIRKRYANLNVKLHPESKRNQNKRDDLPLDNAAANDLAKPSTGSPGPELLSEAKTQPWASRVPEKLNSRPSADTPTGKAPVPETALESTPVLDDSTISPRSLTSSDSKTPTLDNAPLITDVSSWKLDQADPVLSGDPVFTDNALLASLHSYKPHLFPF